MQPRCPPTGRIAGIPFKLIQLAINDPVRWFPSTNNCGRPRIPTYVSAAILKGWSPFSACFQIQAAMGLMLV